MEIGIGLPTTIPGVEGGQILEWARRADRAGFSSLGVLDRIVYPNLEPLVALAAAAAVTERVRLTTSILIVPYRANAALLAKQAATVQHLSGGRFVLGIAVGGREDDYQASGVSMRGRGRRFEEMLDEMKRIWAGEERGVAGGVGPEVDPPTLLVGGQVDAAFRRAAELGDGWIMGGGTPEQFAQGRDKLLAAWRNAGRDGTPRTAALAYFGMGERADEDARANIGHYYAWLGDYAEAIVGSVAKGDDMVSGYIRGFSDVGCDELILFPSSADPEQVDLLARAAL
jgi:alkanesulfonate monooxygenase SsuD/methylene tetrahydromethanopterin reductase-like flavin-dependent oxidoreductase (luciferase family)